jgi:hypothetical protein
MHACGSARVSRNFVAKAMRRSLDPVFSYFLCFTSVRLGSPRIYTALFISKEGARASSEVAPQNPADAQWIANKARSSLKA